MSKMVCKYNFQNSEKFNGEPYCCLFNEKCKDLSFVCDKNCQVYEDYKQLEELKVENLGFKILHESDKDLLKRKEQECEGLRYEIGSLENDRDILQEQLDQLQAENEKIKTALKFRDSNIDAKNKEIIRKCKNNRELIDKNWKLIKTLTEIKEIGKKSMREGKMLSGGWLYQFIEQKISEVLDVENN